MELVFKKPHKACSGNVTWDAVATSLSPQNDRRMFGHVRQAFIDLKVAA